MARYYFDIHNGISLMRDTVGDECVDFQAVREEAINTLPAIARDAIPKDGDRQAFTINVRNEANQTVYTATLTFAGLQMDDDIPLMDNLTD